MAQLGRTTPQSTTRTGRPVAVLNAAAGSVSGTIATGFGGLASTVTGTPKVLGTITTAFGALASTVTGTPKILGTVSTNFGALASTVVGTPKVIGTIATPFGALATAASATRTILASITTAFGALASTVTGSGGSVPAPPQEDTGSHGGGILGQTRPPIQPKKPTKVIFDALPAWFKVIVHLEPTTTVVAVVSLDELAAAGASGAFATRDALPAAATQEARAEAATARSVTPYCVQHGERRHTGESLDRLNDDDEQVATAIASYLLTRSHA